ncbi:5-formyltetrahydrofolate cyclo-ligase [Hydrogenimonas sp.]
MDKKIFRQVCRHRLEKAEKYGRLQRNRTVLLRLKKIIKKYNPKSVMLYLPMAHEVDVKPLFRYLRGNKKIYVPFMEGKSFKLVQYRLPLQKKRFGIYEPKISHFFMTKIDMAIVPVVGVDGRFRRVGFGKGMYDRFFASLREKPLTVFVQLTKCHTKEKITDDYDIQADIYITPEDTIVRGKYYDNRDRYRRCRSRD